MFLKKYYSNTKLSAKDDTFVSLKKSVSNSTTNSNIIQLHLQNKFSTPRKSVTFWGRIRRGGLGKEVRLG